MHVCIFGKFSDPSVVMFNDVDLVNFDCDLKNGPDDVLYPVNMCSHGKVDCPDMPEYGRYCGFDLKIAVCAKELGETVDFYVQVMVPVGRLFNKTPLPQIHSLSSVDGRWFGCDRKTETMILTLTDISFLPRSWSTSKSAWTTKQVVSPDTPVEEMWVTPRVWCKQIISHSPAERNKSNCLDVPIRSVALETTSDVDDSYGKSYHCGVWHENLTLHSVVINSSGARRWVSKYCKTQNSSHNTSGAEPSHSEPLTCMRWYRQCSATWEGSQEVMVE